ncbi:acyltransferase family protein [Nocardioides baculatus]|uniref:Acyltransferase n=1 Tax=Nocardioides baculatus TaxID=2801337 RepID=A0ABS1LCM0_9ACTN|nr:acyltransferase family protein [Nocardioides baculatus]MBL0749128.1 acyltransferase [Nocardioides baculatus]
MSRVDLPEARSTVQAQMKHSRRPDVQGLRAIAVLMVIAFHAGLPVPGGYIGVDVFFVISGFVITGLLLREHGRSGTINLRRFYGRRLRRLAPALALMLTTVLVLSVFLQSPLTRAGGQELTAQTALGASFFSANAVLYRVPVFGYFAERAADNPLLHTWSLSVEEQFYLVFPFIVLLAARRRVGGSRSVLTAVVAVVAALSLLASVVLSYELVTPPGITVPAAFAFYVPLTRAWEFAAGALVALAASRLRGLGAIPTRVAAAVGAAGLVVSAGLLSEGRFPFPGAIALVPVASTAMLIAAGTSLSSSLPTRLLSTPVMSAIGDRSYSLYLWHWPFIVFSTIVPLDLPILPLLGALLSVVPAMVAYRYVENPIRLGTVSTWRVAVVATALPAIVAAAVLGGVSTGWGSDRIKGQRDSVAAPTLGVRSGCFVDGEADPGVFDRCTFPVEGRASAGTIMLVGDSHADGLSDGVVEAGNDLGYDVVMATGAACPYVGPAVPTAGLVSNCPELTAWRTEFATENKVDLVVTAQSALDRASDPDAWVSGNVEVLEQLDTAGVPVLLIGDVPYVGANGSPCRYGIINPSCTVSREQVLDVQGPGLGVDADVAERLENVSLWSPFDRFCGAVTCSAVDGRTTLYRDPEHLNAYGSLFLADDLEVEMQRAIEAAP